MIINLLQKTWKPLILIAIISVITTWAFNIQNLLVSETIVNNIKIRTFDIRNYMLNISNAWESNALAFEDILPPRTYSPEVLTLDQLTNNLAYIFDWIYFPINFILWVLRWFCWLIKILLAIIGWNVGTNANGEYYSQLAKILVWITQNLMIPYI